MMLGVCSCDYSAKSPFPCFSYSCVTLYVFIVNANKLPCLAGHLIKHLFMSFLWQKSSFPFLLSLFFFFSCNCNLIRPTTSFFVYWITSITCACQNAGVPQNNVYLRAELLWKCWNLHVTSSAGSVFKSAWVQEADTSNLTHAAATLLWTGKLSLGKQVSIYYRMAPLYPHNDFNVLLHLSVSFV